MRLVHRARRRQAEPLHASSRWRSWRPAPRSSPSKASARPRTCTRCKSAWMAHGGAQCGVCTPGFIMSAKALLDTNKSPTREQVRGWFNRNRNLCRCTGYKPLIDAVMDAAAMMRGEKTAEEVLAKRRRRTARSSARSISARPRWPRSPAHGTSAPTLRCTCRANTLRLALVQAKVTHASSRASTPPKPRRCPAS